MRTLSTGLTAKLTAAVTEPGYLVQIDWASSTSRLSSRGTLEWGGHTWTGWEVKVSGLRWDGAAGMSGRLELGNTDLTFSALVLADGIAGRRIQVWKFYSGSPAADEALQVFDGVGDRAEIGAQRVSIELAGENVSTLYSPRTRIAAPLFNWVPAAGTVIRWGGQTAVLDTGIPPQPKPRPKRPW